MGHRDDPRTRYEDELIRLKRVVGEDSETSGQLRGDVSDADAGAIREVLDALDPDRPAKVFRANGDGAETKEPKTLANYAGRFRLAATELDGDLLDQTTSSINELMGDMVNGDADVAPDGGYSKGSIGQYQSALKAFYRYHDGHGVDPEDIPVFAPDETSVDERDMFSVEEIQAMRDAIDSPRERCLFELLAYTGQRIRAIQTLRIKDVDVTEGVLYLNEDADGMKGAKGKRPLLGAEEYVRRWLDYHPTGEPEDYLITPKKTGGGTPGDMLTQDTIRYHLTKAADKAGVEKKVHPQIFRHYFTTIAKRDYDLDDAYIKHLRGDSPGSNVMETTYRHLSDGDAVKHAEAKFEGREPERETALTPEVCPTCGEILDPGAKACSRCATVFTPDAKAARDEFEDRAFEQSQEAEPGSEVSIEVDKLRRAVRDNPDAREQVLDAIMDGIESTEGAG